MVVAERATSTQTTRFSTKLEFPKGVNAFGTDIDGTLSRGISLVTIGQGLIDSARKAGNEEGAAKMEAGFKEIYAILGEDHGWTGLVKGLHLFYDTLIDSGIGDQTLTIKFAKQHIEQNLIPSVDRFVSQESRVPGMLSFPVTAGGFFTALYVKDKYNTTNIIANMERYNDKGVLVQVTYESDSPEKKLQHARYVLGFYGIEIAKDFAYVGNDSLDVPLLKSVKRGRAFAAPGATDDVKAIPGIVQIR